MGFPAYQLPLFLYDWQIILWPHQQWITVHFDNMEKIEVSTAKKQIS